MDTRDPGLVLHSTGSHTYIDPARSLYFQVAKMAASFHGSCNRRNIGAVLVVDGRIREVGWNGMERSEHRSTCVSGACPRGQLSAEQQPHGVGYSNCIYLHAEYNVLENFRHGQRIQAREGWAASMGARVYLAGYASDGSPINPCEDCIKLAGWAGAQLIWEQ